MDCAEAKLQIESYVAGEIAPDLKEQLEAHLAGCAECRLDSELTRASRNAPVVAPPLEAPAAPTEAPPAAGDGGAGSWTLDSIFGSGGSGASGTSGGTAGSGGSGEPSGGSEPAEAHEPESPASAVDPAANAVDSVSNAADSVTNADSHDFGAEPRKVAALREGPLAGGADEESVSMSDALELPSVLDDPLPSADADEPPPSDAPTWDFEPADEKGAAKPPEGSLFFAEAALSRTGKKRKKSSVPRLLVWGGGGLVGIALLAVSVWIALTIRQPLPPATIGGIRAGAGPVVSPPADVGSGAPGEGAAAEPEPAPAQTPATTAAPQPVPAPVEQSSGTPTPAPGLASPAATPRAPSATSTAPAETPSTSSREVARAPEPRAPTASAPPAARRRPPATTTATRKPPAARTQTAVRPPAHPPLDNGASKPATNAGSSLPSASQAQPSVAEAPPSASPTVAPNPPSVTNATPPASDASPPKPSSGEPANPPAASTAKTAEPPPPTTAGAEPPAPAGQERPIDRLHLATLNAEQKADLTALRKLRDAWRGMVKASIGPDRPRAKRELADCLWAVQTLTSKASDQKEALAAYRDYVLNAPAGGADARTVARMRQLEDALADNR